MYQVISVRVLRQAMAWMGIPAPWFRTTDFMRWPDGRLTSTIKCMWNYSEILAWDEARYGEGCGLDGDQGKQRLVTKLWAALLESFCEDVQVVHVQYSEANRWFVAYLTCTIQPSPYDGVIETDAEFKERIWENL